MYVVLIYMCFLGVVLMNSQEYLKKYNLVSTRSVERIEDLIYPDYNTDLATINYNNCINVYELIRDFNKAYHEFKKDFSTLTTIDVLNEYNISSYYESPCFQSLRYSNKEYVLNFLNIGSSYKLIKNDISNIEGKTNLNIDPEIVKSYLEFGSKYQDLINKYNVIVNTLNYLNINNGIVVSLKFDNNDINNLNFIMYSFGIYGTIFIVKYLLDDNLTLDAASNASYYKFNEEEIENIAKNIYLDKSFVYGLDAFKKDKSLTLKK